MPKHTHGGDDDTEGGEEKATKLKLERFGHQPDKNIRDLFWKIMEAKAGKKEISKEDLTQAKEHRFIFIEIAGSLIKINDIKRYGISHGVLCRNLIEFFVDNNFEDALLAQLAKGMDDEHIANMMAKAVKEAVKKDGHRKKITAFFKEALRKPAAYPVILFYLPKIKDRNMAAAMKEELKIFAQGDSMENQLNAIAALSVVNDNESAKIISALLSNWDVEIRRAAAESLKKMNLVDEAIETIKSRMEDETDEETKKILRRIVIKWKK